LTCTAGVPAIWSFVQWICCDARSVKTQNVNLHHLTSNTWVRHLFGRVVLSNNYDWRTTGLMTSNNIFTRFISKMTVDKTETRITGWSQFAPFKDFVECNATGLSACDLKGNAGTCEYYMLMWCFHSFHSFISQPIDSPLFIYLPFILLLSIRQ